MSTTPFAPAPGKRRLNRNAVVEAAVLLFNQQGYDRTSMNGIATVLGITKPALYYHFASKEDILIAGIDRASEVVRAALEASEKPGASPAEQVEAFVRAYGRALPDPIFRCLVLADERVLGSAGQAQIRACKRHNQHRLEELLQQAGVAPGEVRAIALAVFGALNWSATAFGDRIGAESEKVTDATLKLLSAVL